MWKQICHLQVAVPPNLRIIYIVERACIVLTYPPLDQIGSILNLYWGIWLPLPIHETLVSNDLSHSNFWGFWRNEIVIDLFQTKLLIFRSIVIPEFLDCPGFLGLPNPGHYSKKSFCCCLWNNLWNKAKLSLLTLLPLKTASMKRVTSLTPMLYHKKYLFSREY